MTTTSEIWEGDVLGRSEEAQLLIKFLVARSAERAALAKGYVLNLNAGWGRGKTFFLQRLHTQLQSDGFLSVYVNAWQDDAGDEPLVSVISALDNALQPHLSAMGRAQKIWSAAKTSGGELLGAIATGAVKRIARKLIDDGVDEIGEIVERQPSTADSSKDSEKKQDETFSGETAKAVAALADKFMKDKLAAHKLRLKSVETFKMQLSSLIQQIVADGTMKPPLFIFIDELDRCRPTYAVEMLEQIKHLFDVNGVVFVVATDSEQLSHSICALYGDRFDSVKYLGRFFERQFQLSPPTLDNYAKLLFKVNSIDENKLSSPQGMDHAHYIARIAHQFNLSLRDLEQCLDIIASISSIWEHKVKIELMYMAPLVFAYQSGSAKTFSQAKYGIFESTSGPAATLPLRQTDRLGREGPPKIVALLDYTKKSATYALNNTLVDMVKSSDDGDLVDAWVRGRFMEEFQILHGGRYMTNNPPSSIIIHYPDLICRMASIIDPTLLT